MMTFLFALFFLQTPTQGKTPQMEHQKKQAVSATQDPSRSIMIIDPKMRAADYQKAFEMLKAEKSTSKVFFELADGTKISNVIDMKLMPDNTLIVFRYSTPQGIRFQVVELEDIMGIMHQ